MAAVNAHYNCNEEFRDCEVSWVLLIEVENIKKENYSTGS